MHTRRWLVHAVQIAAVVLVISGLLVTWRAGFRKEQGSSERVLTQLQLGYRPKALADVTPVIIQEARLGRENLKVELVAVSSPADGFNKLQNGECDALAGMPMEAIFRQMTPPGPKRKFRAYYLQVDMNQEGWVSLVVRKDSGLLAVKDLAGRTTATLATDQAEYLLRRILVAAGVPPEQVRTVRYNPSTPLLGLRNREHDAIFGLEPAISEALAEGHGLLWRGPVSHFLFNDRPIPVSGSLIAEDFVASHPRAVAEFVSIVDDAVALAQKETGRVRAYFSKPDYGDMKPAVTQRLFLPVMAKPSDSLKEVTDQYMNELVRDGLLKEKIDLGPLFPADK
jgi:ABC-type nitrate/sulfonate/bicarbonate transport system substrate-binding protein